MTVPQLVAAYKRWHVNAVEVTRGGVRARDHHRPGVYGDMHGQVAHHTGPYGTVAGMVAMLWVGRPDLPGPLCTDGIDPAGVVYIVAGGRSNHAGSGSASVLSALIADRAPAAPGPDNYDGNRTLYGDELFNPGDRRTPYPDVQVEAAIRVHAARAEHHGWTGVSTIRHGGWTRRKVDTLGTSASGDGLTQTFLQAEVARALREGPDGYTYPATVQEDDMNVAELDAYFASDKGKERIRAAVWDTHQYGGRDLEAVLVAGANAAVSLTKPTV
jgi:hypothetical protein